MMDNKAKPLRGIVCAGGQATRLGELTEITNKHLLPVGAWPMIYYALTLLEKCDVREVLLVSGPDHGGDFMRLLGDGVKLRRGTDEPLFEVDLTYKVQTGPRGIADAILKGEQFADGAPVVVCLADNVFQYVPRLAINDFRNRATGAKVFLKRVADPERFGVAVFEGSRLVDIAEKPGVVDKRFATPPSEYAVTGLYCYGPDVFDVIRSLAPSARGELEVADVNRIYIEQGRMEYENLRGWWRDAGTPEALAEIAALVQADGANNTLDGTS